MSFGCGLIAHHRSVGLTLCGLVCACLFASGGTALGQTQVDRLFPVAVAIGQESQIKAEGKFAAWPPKIVCDRAGVLVQAMEESGELKVTVDSNAPPGVAWLRMHDDKSASRLVPLLIEPMPITVEAEPNNTFDESALIGLPAVVNGRLEKSRQVDTYRVNLKEGQTLVVATIAHRILRSPMDAVLQLVDDRGNVVLQADDGVGLDPTLVFRVEHDGEYAIRIFAFPETPTGTIGYAGGSSFTYQLRITCGEYVDHVLPLIQVPSLEKHLQAVGWNLSPEPVVSTIAARGYSPALAYVDGQLGWQWLGRTPTGDTATRSTSVVPIGDGETVQLESTPAVLFGCLNREGQVDRVRWSVAKGDAYHARLHAREFGLPTDSVLRVIALTDNRELVSNDDPKKGVADSIAQFTAKEDGEVELQISDLVDGFSRRHAYTVELARVQPKVSLEIAADSVAVASGKEAEIVVTLNREQGFKEKVEISLDELPDGVHVEPVASEPKGKTASSVKLKVSADKTATYSGPIQIVGRVLDEEGSQVGAKLPAVYRPCELVEVPEIWLTVAP